MPELLKELQEKFGKSEGLRIFNTILPGIMGDFNKMLEKAGTNMLVTEEYRLEDGSGVIKVKGKKNANGEITVEAHFSS
ncbi:MAG: hypothetical protein K6F00_00180 [Lachnospiraceae bacterium]|nr:hypothetical protein [Lachnospiraceae bacterium]